MTNSELFKLDADALFSLVPELRNVERLVDGFCRDSGSCWEKNVRLAVHRDLILKALADCVGPTAKVEQGETLDPLAQTQAAYDVMVEHFFGEFFERNLAEFDPELRACIESCKTPADRQYLLQVVLPALLTKDADEDISHPDYWMPTGGVVTDLPPIPLPDVSFGPTL